VRRLLLVPLLAAVAAAAAVGGVAAAASPIDGVAVTGKPGEQPTVRVSSPVKVDASRSDVLARGTGERAKQGSTLKIDYTILNGRDGTVLESSYGDTPASVVLNTKQALPVLVTSLIGKHVGDRVLIAIAPKEGLTATAPASSGVQKDDTLLFVVDVEDSSTPLPRATGAKVPPVAGLPTVTRAASGEPSVKIPRGDPPATLVAQPLIEGTGPVVQAGQTVTVHYRALNWRTSKTFDSSWARHEPDALPIGVDRIMKGWDEGLVGRTVGSQMLLVVPPDKGYGPSGQPSIGITGTDTMVFVVDILAAS
jgi:peptidylprolyl isomerase